MEQPHVVVAVETSAARGSIALAIDGDAPRTAILPEAKRHAAGLIPAIRELLFDVNLNPRDISLYCFSAGPGSFTGLRVAATVGRMLQSAVGCQVVAVSTLEALAHRALIHSGLPETVVPILDARGGRVFAAVFERQGHIARLITPPHVAKISDVLAQSAAPFHVLGDATTVYRDACEAAGAIVMDAEFDRPRVESVLAIGRRAAGDGLVAQPEEITPVYLRRPEAEEVYETRRAAARERRGE